MTISTDLAGGSEGQDGLSPLLATALDALRKGVVERNGPTPQGTPEHVATTAHGSLLHDQGVGADQALAEIGQWFTENAIDPADPACAAHLHTPPLAVAVAADMLAAVANSSLDSWDQGPSGALVEESVVRTMAELAGYAPDRATGAMTSGGTESNLTALLLARERADRDGMVGRRRVLCSDDAHFSIARNCAVLGLGEDAVERVEVDAHRRMDTEALRRKLDEVRVRGEAPIAVVATAGTTDLGSIDPLPEIAEIASERGIRTHVDAAYGGGALFSENAAPLLNGLRLCDSVAIDLHKLGWQPVAAGMLLVRDAELFEPLERRVAYLNTADDEQAGYHSLLGRSLRTTRRADALKVAVTLRALGTRGLGELVDRCRLLARHAAARINAEPNLRLYSEPGLTTVVFRLLPERGDADTTNAALRRTLLSEGRAVIGRTELDGTVWLKLTLLNPKTTEADIDALLDTVLTAGAKEQR